MRTLRADEIECRVGTSTNNGVSLLLYKDARVDMRLLDEVYGPMNWQRHHEVINGNLYCTIQIWDNEKLTWVSKQDVGKESLTEGEKGEASDSFKRAGFNWGIGRELYTAPFIWVTTDAAEYDNKGRIKTHFYVREISYNDNREISHLVIVDGKGKARYTFGKTTKNETPTSEDTVTLDQAIAEMYAVTSWQEVINIWNKYPQFKNEEAFRTTCTEMGVKYPKQ